MTMKPVVIDNVKGKDLPQGWADRAGVRPDEEVRITIGPGREDAAKELVRLMDWMGKEAKRNGLSEEKLADLLRDG